MKLLLLLLLSLNLIAQNEYSLRVAYGEASTKDLKEIILFDLDRDSDNLTVFSLDGGYLLKKEILELPLDFYIKGGLSYFNEGDAPTTSSVYEGVIYVKLYYNLDFLENRVRFGLGEGLSYTSDILWSEYKAANKEQENSSKLLNYLDISVDFDLGKLVSYKPLEKYLHRLDS